MAASIWLSIWMPSSEITSASHGYSARMAATSSTARGPTEPEAGLTSTATRRISTWGVSSRTIVSAASAIAWFETGAASGSAEPP
jgi:hypothetical protein